MDKLSKQDQDFVKEVAITGNQTQAAKDAYGIEDDAYARVKGHKKITKDNIATAVAEVKRSLAEQIPDSLVIEKHIALLNKTEKKYNSDGDLISEEIDTNAVKAGVDMSYKLKGAYSDEATKPPVVLMPVLVRFLDIKDDGTSSNRDTNRIP